MNPAAKWRFAVDRGGTFTDVIGVDPSGAFHTHKLLSHSSEYADASIEGIRRILGLKADSPLPEDDIEGIRFGTTVATNALLERKGGKVALFITEGFRDLLEIGYQDRPDIFQLCIKKAPPLYSKVIEVSERISCSGETITKLDEALLREEVQEHICEGVDAAAVVLMHSWKCPDHELLCERILQEAGVANIFLSHRTVNQVKIVSRGQSTVVDAYLSVVLARYLEGIRIETGRIPIEFMQSSGMLTLPETFKGKNALLSGPAGGVVAVASIADDMTLGGAIGFDMGGTSTDVSRYGGAFHKKYEQSIDGIPLQVEMMDIVTVAAGGGSVLGFDGQKMTVGPESAGSYPGPACYGFGGPLTVTDANLITGRLIPELFPRTFGSDRNQSIDKSGAVVLFRALTDEINAALDMNMTVEEAALGFLRVANEKMALAIKEISVSRGYDIRDDALVCFGGAGGQHACSLATLLAINRVIIHPLSGVLSAYGIGLSKTAWKNSRTVLYPFTQESHAEIGAVCDDLERELVNTSCRQRDTLVIRKEIDIRPSGTETFLTLEYSEYEEMLHSFRQQYEKLYGFAVGSAVLEAVNVKVEVHDAIDFTGSFHSAPADHQESSRPLMSRDLYFHDGPASAPVFRSEDLPPSSKIAGPAIVIDSQFTVVIDPGFRAEIDKNGTLFLHHISGAMAHQDAHPGGPDPVLLEVFNNIFMGVAAEMGLTLQNTAYSVNMKERLDFSCALFDAAGSLVANAPHIPVHLGSMADTVQEVITARADEIHPGDAYLTNNPYRGGSHLPDMTVVCPVFSDAGDLIFFTAARGHHSDVGGTTPGSMPPTASHIDEEGVLIDTMLLVRDGKFMEDAAKAVLLKHRYPVRNIDERLSDFRSQIAACHKGVEELRRIIDSYGMETVRDYMKYIQANAEFAVQEALHRFLKGKDAFRSSFKDCLDDGTEIAASVALSAGDGPPHTLKAVIDFTGTGRQHDQDNLNAPASVTRSAVLYVLRSLVDSPIPLNSGCLRPVEIIIPGGTVISPEYPAPVASGNVETSQRIVDVLLGAFGVAAASQGTMNNLLFEVEGESPYYETIAGGSGALEGCSGASGVQVHMTNTRMTDPEVLEFRHPGVRLEQFTLRKKSGGRGSFHGGDGVVRGMKFLKPATVSIISERRHRAPYGMHGGGSGLPGKNFRQDKNGTATEMGHREVLNLAQNESIVIETPGGGGWGEESA